MITVTGQLIIVLTVHRYILASVNKHVRYYMILVISLIGCIFLCVCGFIMAALHHKCLCLTLLLKRSKLEDVHRKLERAAANHKNELKMKDMQVSRNGPPKSTHPLVMCLIFSFSMNFWLTNWPRNFTSWVTRVMFKTASSRLPRWRIVIETCKLHVLMMDMRVITSTTQDAMEALQKEVGDRGI